MKLPQGVILNSLQSHSDERGIFTEIFRESWVKDYRYIQWNVVKSNLGVMRGVHIHKKHFDYLTIVNGSALIGLHDMRKNSSTFQLSVFVDSKGSKLNTLIIPPGVAHGFYFFEPSIHLYAVSEYWNIEDELGCHFLEKQLKLDWPNKSPILSERDKNLPNYEQLLQKFYIE
ncbi:MAG: dTDP-4-dehydrorhamnose 3,5-epimerase family protein [Bacteroidetes bacterium]|nr:dTDP-4-dehydrorhamnose 3,5-epimerase family protein [Bacteroidota bacterium]